MHVWNDGAVQKILWWLLADHHDASHHQGRRTDSGASDKVDNKEQMMTIKQ
jgi:hypothetical protein